MFSFLSGFWLHGGSVLGKATARLICGMRFYSEKFSEGLYGHVVPSRQMNQQGLCSKPWTNPELNTKHGKTAFRQQAASADSEGGQLGERPVWASEKLSGMQAGWRSEPTWPSC